MSCIILTCLHHGKNSRWNRCSIRWHENTPRNMISHIECWPSPALRTHDGLFGVACRTWKYLSCFDFLRIELYDTFKYFMQEQDMGNIKDRHRFILTIDPSFDKSVKANRNERLNPMCSDGESRNLFLNRLNGSDCFLVFGMHWHFVAVPYNGLTLRFYPMAFNDQICRFFLWSLVFSVITAMSNRLFGYICPAPLCINTFLEWVMNLFLYSLLPVDMLITGRLAVTSTHQCLMKLFLKRFDLRECLKYMQGINWLVNKWWNQQGTRMDAVQKKEFSSSITHVRGVISFALWTGGSIEGVVSRQIVFDCLKWTRSMLWSTSQIALGLIRARRGQVIRFIESAACTIKSVLIGCRPRIH